MKFLRRNSLIGNIVLMIVISIAIIMALLFWVGHYTRHGDSVIVPPLRGLSFLEAEKVLKDQGLRGEIVDSNYFEGLAPGSVYESLPEEGAKVKPGRIIFLTVNAFSPKLVQLPSNLEGMSMRQAKATLEGLGFRVVQIRQVPGEFNGLTAGVEDSYGRTIAPGTKLQAKSSLVLLVTRHTSFIEDELTQSIEDSIRAQSPVVEEESEKEDESWW